MGLLILLAIVGAYVGLNRISKRNFDQLSAELAEEQRFKTKVVLLGGLLLTLGSCSFVPSERSLVSMEAFKTGEEADVSVAFTEDAGYRFILNMGADRSSMSYPGRGTRYSFIVYTANNVLYIPQLILSIIVIPIGVLIIIKRIQRDVFNRSKDTEVA